MLNSHYSSRMEFLVSVIQELSLAKDTQKIVNIVRHAARELTGAEGATFILRDGEKCYYVDEDAISPLWKGNRFPIDNCVSGWVMKHKESIIIDDIYKDDRIPIDLYEPTFVRSLVMVPIRTENPIGAIGNYWASYYHASDEELRLLQMLANSTSIALENVSLYSDLGRQLKRRDEFLSMAAHEIKTPITPLSLRMQQIQKIFDKTEIIDGETFQKIKKHIAHSSREISEIIRLMDNFLDVARMSLEKFAPQKQPLVNLNEIILQLIEQFRFSHGAKINCHLLDEVVGSFDPIRLQQLFRNILSNAVRYGGQEPIDIKVEKVGADNVRVSVQDKGEGITREEQERIFERFERGNASINYGGMGLGLYIARQIVNGHGGKIWVESDAGKGSLFYVELPLSQASHDALK